MKIGFSLKQTWTALVLFAVIVPATIVMIWYGQNSYRNQLDSALTIERQANESLRYQLESEIKRFKTLLKNKSDPMSFLLDRKNNPTALRDINGLLRNIIEREQTIRGVMILSKQADVIAVVEPGLGLSGDKLLPTDVLNMAGKHWGFDKAFEHPEIAIPSMGRIYISSSKQNEDYIAFYIAVPIGQPAKAVLIAEFDVERLWSADAQKELGIGQEKPRDYVLDRHGTLITGIHGSDYKPGDIMTHLAIARASLISGEWSVESSYIGVIDQPVFGTLTYVPSLNWALISEVIVSTITRPIWKSLLKIFLFTLLGEVIFVWFVLYLASKTLKPIQHACEAMEHVARGDYQFVLQPCGIRELDTMTTEFNNMAQARQDAENLLLEREQNLDITLNSIGDAVIATDAEGNVVRMNPIAEQLTGWPFEEAQGQPLNTIFPIINAATREPMENPVEKVMATGETVYLSNHATLISKDGTEYQIADSAAPIRDKGHISGMVLVFNDVTEPYRLRQAVDKSKRDLQAIMDNAPAVIYVKDTEGHYIFINRQFETLFHIPREGIVGKVDHDVFSKHFADEFRRNDKAVLKAGHALELEEVAPHDDGLHSYVSIKFPLFNEKDDIYAVCSISTDITERIQQEEQLRRSQKMDALGKLTGGIAHDYNNLLGIIMGYAEQLNDHLAHDSKLSKYAHEIQHATERGARLTKKLLAFSRQKTSDATVLDINTLLQDEQLMLEKTLTVRIKLVFDLADGLWPVYLDSSDLEDAVINMSVNAMYAMDKGGELTLRTSNQQLNAVDAELLHLKAGDYVLFSMTDTGSGMDKATKEKIFDPFYSTKGKRGTGLGLSQVYGFMQRSGGAIKVYSEPGHGSRFALYFPRSHESDTGMQPTTAIEKQNLRGSETLLVVDDEPALLELARDILTAQGYRVLTANDGEQALLVLEKDAIDLIISDVIMPNMDGYQLATQVQQRYPHIKLQMVSGFADDRHNNMNMTDGALHQNMLYKPYTSNTLLTRVRSLLDGGSATDILAGRTILVMDDEEEVRELFKLNLQKLGCRTLPACDGDEAIAFYRQSQERGEPIDAVILDLSIPGKLSGKDVAAKIRSLDPRAKIIVASGHTEGPEMTHYRDYGFNGALEKTFNREKIKKVLEQVLSIV